MLLLSVTKMQPATDHMESEPILQGTAAAFVTCAAPYKSYCMICAQDITVPLSHTPSMGTLSPTRHH